MKRKEYLQKKKRRGILHKKEKRAHRELWQSFNIGDVKAVTKVHKILESVIWELDLLRKELREIEIYM